MTYREALKYLDSFVDFEKVENYNYKSSLKLERVKRLAALLGDPQKATPAIHVAGTKGKGSTAAYIYSILKAANFRVGLYTSPHLISFRERIRINDPSTGLGSSRAKSRDDYLISEEDLAWILGKIRDMIESSMKEDRPSFFEVYTMLAYLYFKEKKIDFAVYEVGLGGRLDATNIIDPLICAITPLSYEHTDKLGNTLEEIATEKCGIIKNGITCVVAPQDKEAYEVIEGICKARHSKLISVGKDIKFEELKSSDSEEVFNVSGVNGKYPNLRSRLIGSHQIVNAAVAIGVIEALKERGIIIPADAVRNGIENARWEGRLEIINRRPFIVLDGAQNRESAKTLVSAIKKIFKYKKLILVFGVSKDKDVRGMLEEMLPICDSIVLTKSKILNRALEPAKIKEEILNMEHSIKDIILTSNTEEALSGALSMASPEDIVLITGSLFIVGEMKEHCQRCVKTV